LKIDSNLIQVKNDRFLGESNKGSRYSCKKRLSFEQNKGACAPFCFPAIYASGLLPKPF